MNNEQKLRARKKQLRKQIEKREDKFKQMLSAGSFLANVAEFTAGKILSAKETNETEKMALTASKKGKKKKKKSKLKKAAPLVIQVAAVAAGFFLARYAVKKLFDQEETEE